MNTPLHAPLDPHEQALAQALANLPELEPSAQLDAWVLATARAERHRPVKPRPSWFGAAFAAVAVAVLAVGITWQASLYDPLRNWHFDTPSAPVDTRPDVIDVTIAKPEAGAQPTQDEIAPASKAEQAAAFAGKRSEPAESAPAANLERHRAQAVQPAPPQRQLAPRYPPASHTDSTPRPAPAPVPASPPATDAATVPQPVSPPPSARQVLSPPATTRIPAGVEADAAAWLERIRTHLHQGERDQAAAELRAFQQHYPDLAIPDDLKDLLDP